MKKVLIILPNLPFPLNSGGNIGVFEMINELRSKVLISLIVPSDNEKDLNELKMLWPNVDFYSFKKNLNFFDKCLDKLKKISLLISLFSLSKEFNSYFSLENSKTYRDSIYANHVNSSLLNTCINVINKLKFDFIQIEFFKFLPLINFLPPGENYIFVHHELRFIRLEREYKLIENTLSGINNYFLDQIKGLELSLLEKYNKIICLSDVDKQILSNYIDTDKLLTSPLTIKIKGNNINNYSFSNKLLFVGGSGHYPNVDGIIWFINNCWGDIVNEFPDIKLEIIGNWDKKFIKMFKNQQNIVFKGFVEDLGDHLKDGILVVPIRIGSGMRMKIIDAVNYGVPFVSTTIGVEGIDLIHGIECYIEDDSKKFANRVIELVNSDSNRKMFIENASNKLREAYSYHKLIQSRIDVYKD